MNTLAQKVWKWEAWANQTTVQPLALACVGLLMVAVLMGRRKDVAVYFMMLGMFIPQAQRVVLGGLDFDFMRLLTMAAVLRLLIRSEWRLLTFGPQEWLMCGFVLTAVVGATIRTGGELLVNRLGFGFDAIGLYLVFRICFRHAEDFVWLLRVTAVLSVLVLSFFVVERGTGRNLFSVMGGVPEVTVVRNGRLRCQGAFSHAILAGVFMSVLLAWFVGLVASKRSKALGWLGIFSSFVVIGLTASSTPVSSLILALVAWSLFPLRRWFPLALAFLPFVLLFLNFAINKGIFYLFAKIDFVGGSTGWHRYHLMDRAMANFGEWWLVGVADTSHWGPGLYDVTNQYVLEGVRGGLLPMVFLLALIVRAFLSSAKSVRSASVKRDAILSYSLGVAIFVHAIVFLSVSYFGQSVMLWYLSLAVTECSRTWWTRGLRSDGVVPGPGDGSGGGGEFRRRVLAS